MPSQTEIGSDDVRIDEPTLRRDLRRAIDDAARDGVEAAILFGSRARGDARSDSDWDVLVLLEDTEDVATERMAIRQALFDIGRRNGAKVQPVIMRWSDIHDNVGLMRNVASEGVPL